MPAEVVRTYRCSEALTGRLPRVPTAFPHSVRARRRSVPQVRRKRADVLPNGSTCRVLQCRIMTATKTFKQRIRAGERLVGASIAMRADTDWLRGIVARRPYDFVWVDAQHSPFSEHRLVEFCAAAGEVGVPVVFRLKHTRLTYLVGNFLDLGPTGIEVPQVETEATVDEAVANFYYAPDGVRSWGGAARLGFTGQGLEEYAAYWQETGALAMQIESIGAATNAARRLAKEGVDFFTIGPADMTFDIQRHPNHALQSVDDCVRYLARDLRGTGKQVCMRIAAGDDPSPYHDMGVTMTLEAGVN